MILIVNSTSHKRKLSGTIIKWWEGTTYHHTAVIADDFVYEAVFKGFRKLPLEKWLEKNKILYYQNADKFFNLNEEEAESIVKKAEAYLTDEIPYGSLTLVGIIIYDIMRLKFFRDGRKSLICSEAAYRIFEEYLEPVEDIDYLSPKDVLEIFKMKKYEA